MLELRIQAGQPAIPLMALPIAIGREEAARTVGEQIEAMLALLDELDGDSDLEDDGDLEAIDERDLSYPEWHTRGRHKLTAGGREMTGTANVSDDDEDDDPVEEDGEDCCEAADDDVRSGMAPGYRADERRWSARVRLGCEDDFEPEYDGEGDHSLTWGSDDPVPVYDCDRRRLGHVLNGAAFAYQRLASVDGVATGGGVSC